ncbi:heterokaryon incompatibility protein-domain-containing protein, partial [Tricladium varicosporioides]
REVRARVVPEQVNYQQLKDYISFCETNHGRNCKPDKSLPVPLKLFDCHKRVLVRAAPGRPYFALSYAWDSSTNVPKLGGTPVKHGDLPKVMEDAAELTRKLGKRYLWVDQLCINQDDPQEKAAQMPKMAEIYGGSTLTIISLNHGQDPGLAGVNGTTRKRQETVLTKGIQLISTLKDPLAMAEASYWNTRIWTFQEGAFPCRRLFFTEDQAYFHC